jgi:hypothetical protein
MLQHPKSHVDSEQLGEEKNSPLLPKQAADSAPIEHIPVEGTKQQPSAEAIPIRKKVKINARVNLN